MVEGEGAEAAEMGAEVGAGLARFFGAFFVSSIIVLANTIARFTALALAWDEIVALVIASISSFTRMGSLNPLPMNCLMKPSFMISRPRGPR